MLKYGPAYKLSIFLVFLMLNLTGCDALHHNWSQYNWFGQNTLNSIVNNYKRLPNEKALAVAYLPNGTYQTGYSWSQPNTKDAVKTAIERCTLMVMHYGYQTKCSILYVNDEMQNEYFSPKETSKNYAKRPPATIMQPQAGKTGDPTERDQRALTALQKMEQYRAQIDQQAASMQDTNPMLPFLARTFIGAAGSKSLDMGTQLAEGAQGGYQAFEQQRAANSPSPSCAENGSCYGDISDNTFRPKTTYVQGYYRKNGTYVRGHYRS